MEKKKVAFCLIKAFSSAERLQFKQKIKCGKTAKNGERLEKLFSYLEKAVELDNFDEVKSVRLVKILKLSSAKKLTPFYTELINDLKNFLITSELKKNKLQQQLLLQKALAYREEAQYIELLHNEIASEITSIDVPNPEDYQYQAVFYNNLYTHPSTNTRKEEALVYLNRSETSLDTSYWIQKLRLLIEKANRALALANESHLLKELPELPDFRQYTYNDDSHILSIYARVYKFALAPFQDSDLNDVLLLIKEHSDTIPKGDRERIFNYLMGLINYYIPTQQTNLSTYHIYQVYKLAFTNLWLVQDNGLMYFEDFLNILYLAFQHKDTELLESIGCDYDEYLNKDYHIFISLLSRGYNFFLHERWEAVLKTFETQDLPDREYRLHFIMRRNILELKSLFEAFVDKKIELDYIPSYIDKHNRFLQRKSDIYSPQFKERNITFLKMLKRLYNYLTKRNTFAMDKAQAYKDMTEWLRDVEEIGKNTIDQMWLQSVGERLLQEVSSVASR